MQLLSVDLCYIPPQNVRTSSHGWELFVFSLWTFALCIYHKYRRRTDMEIFTRRL